jgi:hypothetical protein
LKRHIIALKKIVKQRDEELLDMRMAMDVMGYDKSPKRNLSKKSGKKSRNLTKSYDGPSFESKTIVLPSVRFKYQFTNLVPK